MSTLLSIPRSQILVVREENPRTQTDEEHLESVRRSIEANGLVTALTVEPVIPDGADVPSHYKLSAGYTRITALDAIHGGAEYEVPCIVKEAGTADVAALIENVVRQDLPPVDEALRYQQLVDNGMTDVGIANRVGISVARVRARLEILELDPTIVVLIGQGKLPISAVKALLKIQRHHRPLAIDCARYCKARPDLGAILAKRPQEIVSAVGAQKTKPYWPYPCSLTSAEVKTALETAKDLDEQKIADVVKRLAAFNTQHYEAHVHLQGQDGFDLLVGNQAIIPTEKGQPYGVIYDTAPLLQLITAAVAEKERVRAANAKAAAEARLAKKGGGEVDPTADEDTRKAQQEAARQARQAAIEAAKSARGHNLTLGTQLLVDEAGQLKRSNDDVIRLVCLELISAIRLGHVARAGLRLVLSTLQEETTQNVKGVVKTKVTYLQSIGDCEEAARKWVLGAQTADELLHRTVCVLLAAEGALQEAVAQSSRQFPSLAKGDPQELRRKLVEPYLHAGQHAARVKGQWKACDDNRGYDYETGQPVFPASVAPDETPQAGQPDVPPQPEAGA